MAASFSGILTLMVLVCAGPIAWLITKCFRKKNGGSASSVSDVAPDPASAVKAREEVTTQDTKRSHDYLMGPASSVSDVAPDPASAVKAREEVNGIDYLMGLLGYAIGIGNLWRFPYLCGKWGGGAFVLAYLICLVLVAMPAYMIEFVMGQYTRKSTIECFRMIHPRWVGLGYGQAILIFFCLGYYNILLAYACIYVVGSLFDPLPWAVDSAHYWTHDVLNNYVGTYEGVGPGPVQWKILLALFAVWLMVFCSVAFGKRILAKVTWVTVVGPVIMLIVLLCRTVTLEGASDGIEFYIGKFDSAVLGDIEMWASACGQILFSLSPGLGTAITLSSYTKPKEDVVRTCFTVSLCNSAFSLIGGIAIFSIVGNIAHRINEAGGATTVAEQAKSGPGLAFIAIADGMETFGDGTNVMSVLFFMVLLTLGLDSTFAWVETFVCYIDDALQKAGREVARWKIVATSCGVLFLCGLPYCTRMGLELLDTVDHYVTAYFLLLAVSLESVMFMHSFGWERLVVAVKRATLGNEATPLGRNMNPELFWQVCLIYTLPFLPLFLFFFTLRADARTAYEGYPEWVQSVGWSGLIFTLLVVTLGSAINWTGNSSLPPIEEEKASLEILIKQHHDDVACSMIEAGSKENIKSDEQEVQL